MDSRQFKDAAKASIDHSESLFAEDEVSGSWRRTWNDRLIY